MDWLGSIQHSPDKAPVPHAGTGSSSSRRRRFAVKDSSGRRPGSVVEQRLAGLPMPLVQCDDCLQTVLRLTSSTRQHLGWVFFKCKNDGEGGCSFWYWEEEYIDLLIERNLIDVRALLSITEANDAAACAIRKEIRGKATSNSLESKPKNEECKMKNPQINNECMEKILIQLVGGVMKVGYLLKCLVVALFSLVLLF
uniref:Zinc finger GRF-type domain-containing protein n=1 Tax=Hordeum vulgare subsp. vulgare TaxID=112509 RepID=A0A8I6YHT2_HORVV